MSAPRSLLPHFLAALFGLATFYASLQPFEPWLAPAPGAPFFLSPHVWGAVTVSTHPSGHVGDIVRP